MTTEDDIEENVSIHRATVSLLSSDHPDRSKALSELAKALITRFEQTGRMEDLDEAVNLRRTALALCPPGDTNRPASLDKLGSSLLHLFLQTGRMEDLEECIDSHRAALALDLPSIAPLHLVNLANGVQTRFRHRGKMADLEEGIASHRSALKLCPPGHQDRFFCLSNLANGLLIRFEQTGRMEDLEETVDVHRAALEICPPDRSHRFASLNNLANAVHTRFGEMGRIEDLEECVKLHRAALELCPPGHPDRSLSLNNLSNAVHDRFDEMGRTEDLEEVVNLHQEALSLHPPGHPNRSASLNNLANGMETRFQQTSQMEDLEECINLHRQALDLRPPGHPNRASSLDRLANVLLTRCEKTGLKKNLQECIDLHRAALQLYPPGHPDRSSSLKNLASALHLRSRLTLAKRPTASLKDQAEGFDLYQSATEHEFSPVETRLDASISWATLARKRGHPTALGAYKTALSLVARLLALSPTVEMQHQRLQGNKRFSTLAVVAAAHAIEIGNYVEAVEMLEQGRALLWSELYRLRTPLEELQQVDKELADRFLETSRMLERLSTSTEEGEMPVNVAIQLPANGGGEDRIGHLLNRKRHLETTREDLIEKIRNLPGDSFRNFLRATPFEMLSAAAADGPIVVAIVNRSRCDALIILQTRESPVCVPLGGPKVFKSISTLSSRLLDARKSLRTQEKDYNNVLRETLKALWKLVVGPVTRKLLELGIKPGSRIWWCPTSVLGTLPLHAAGIISPALSEAPKAKYLSDIFISSYTPTLMALIRARSQPLVDARPSMLAIWNDRNLRTVREEVETLRELESSLSELHCGDQKTSERVAGELKEHSWVHIACHGQLVPEKPFESSFLLSGDSRLSLLDIVRSQLPNAELAFLSACHSAELTSDGGYDEVIHLAAAMQFCGFRSVVGTMWEMADIDGPHLTRKFYEAMFAEDGVERGSKRAARAIRDAAKSLRKIKGMTLERWVNYVHFGV